jgi:RimJ/RimL family protein N-acetyltransferase
MKTFSVEALTDPERLARRYNEMLDYENHMAFVVQSAEGEIIGVAHAHAIRLYERERFEVSYSRDILYQGSGVGTALMEALFSWSDGRSNVVGFFGDTLLENMRMRRLFEAFGFSCVFPHPEGDPLAVRYRVDFRMY